MRNKTKAILLELPAVILLIAAFLGSIVIKIIDKYPITWGTPILLAIIVWMYLWGRAIERQETRHYY